MNSSPFSLDSVFLPEDAGEDKIDLELTGWEVHGLGFNLEDAHAFKQYASSPPAGSEDLAWSKNAEPAACGWFFTRPAKKGKDRDKLKIRAQSLPHPDKKRRHEAPLCGGYALFYRDRKPHPVTGKTVHRAKLTLALNWQRFIRHQTREDDPRLPCVRRLQRWREDRSSFEEEFAFDGEDNWLPATPAWRDFAAKRQFDEYVGLITKEVDSNFQRACNFQNGGEDAFVKLSHGIKSCRLSTVETLWEFPSDNPIGDVLLYGAKLMHLKGKEGIAKITSLIFKEAKRVLNSPCFVIPIAAGVKLKLYAKTNRRIRFEIVQTNLRKQIPLLLEEAIDLSDPWKCPQTAHSLFSTNPNEFSWTKLPSVLRGLRRRAATHLNQVMEELRRGKSKPAQAYSVVNLLAEVAVAVPAGFRSKATRLSEIKNLLFMLCYQRGFRGSRKQGPLSAALEALVAAGVLEFDRSRQFYPLADDYIAAADALTSATGEPLLSVFGLNPEKFKVEKGGKYPVRLRE